MYIVSIVVEERKNEIPKLQSILTEYGDKIVTRVGFHNEEVETKGVIIVAYKGENIEEFVEDLNTVNGTSINFMKA